MAQDGADEEARDPADIELGRRNTVQSKESEAMAAQMEKYSRFKQGLADIRKNIEEIESRTKQEQVQVADRRDSMQDMDDLMARTTTRAGQLKKQLDTLKRENEEFASKDENRHSATVQMRDNMYNTHVRRYQQVMNSYQQATLQYKKVLKDRSRRQLAAVVDPSMDSEKLDELVDSGRADDIIAEAMITEELDDVVAGIEERHLGIMRLEEQINEIYELFRDLATLVEMQQETMDIIENRISKAKDYAEGAHENLIVAEEEQKKSRRKMVCIFFLVVGLAATVVVVASMFSG